MTAEALRIVAGVSTGLGLLGVVALLIFWGHRNSLKSTTQRLESVEPSAREQALRTLQNRYGIDARKMRPDQVERTLAGQESTKRLIVVAGLIATLVCFTTAVGAGVYMQVVGVSSNSLPRPPQPRVIAAREGGSLVLQVQFPTIGLPSSSAVRLKLQVDTNREFESPAYDRELTDWEKGTVFVKVVGLESSEGFARLQLIDTSTGRRATGDPDRFTLEGP